MIHLRLLLCLCAIWSLTPVANAAEMPIFSDDFGTPALLVEQWKLTPPAAWEMVDGQLVTAADQGTRSAAANVEHDGPVAVRARLKAPKLMPGHWCGITVRGIHFTLRADSFWYVYQVDGVERSLGGLRSSEPPQPDTWYEFEIVNRDQLWQWRVDGELVAEFRESNRVRGSGRLVALSTSGSPLACDQIQISALSANPDASPNLLLNSSFEQPPPDHIPTGWVPASSASIPPEAFWRDWAVVETDAVDGNRALKLAARSGSNGCYTNAVGVAVGQPVTFSVYLKAEQPKTKVQLLIWEWWSTRHRQEVEVGTSWERYTFTVDAPAKNKVRGGLFLPSGQPGVLLDAAQLELADTPSEWRLSDQDGETSTEPYAELPIPEPRTLTIVDEAPTLDGKLDDSAWNAAARLWPLRLPGNEPPREATDTYAVVHGDTLYIAMRCHDSQAETIKMEPTDRDSTKIFGQDNIEIFLDPELDRADYYQLTVSAAGSRFDAGPGRNQGWNGPWEARTSVDEAGWSMEAALPLNMLELTPLTNRAWGINLCRHQARLGEISSTALTVSPNFHLPERYPTLVWPDNRAFTDFLILPGDLAVVEDAPGVARLTGRLLNRTGSDLMLDLNGTFADGMKWELEGLAVGASADQVFSLQLPGTPASKGGESYVTATIRTAGDSPRLLRTLHRSIPVQPVLECLFERSVYATEETATIIATLRLPAADLTDATLRLEPGNHLFTDLEPQLTRTIPIAALPTGAHAFTVTLLGADGQPRAVSNLTLRKLAPTQPAVAVDRVRRCLVVDGQPFFAIGPLHQLFSHQKPAHISKLMNHAADSGYRTVMIVGRIEGEAYLSLWETVFSQALRRDLMVVAWPGGFTKLPDEDFGPFIDTYKSHPSLLAWMPVDEPELYTTAEPTIATLSYFAERDPYHPSYMNNSIMAVPSRFAGLPGDILSVDDYLTNRPNRKVSEMVKAVRDVNEVAIPTRRPTWMFLSGNNLMNHSREPTAGEQVAQTYGSAIAGASGLFYFMGDIISPRHVAATKRTNEELMRLTPVLFSLEPAPAVQSSVPAIELISRRVGSQVYVICVNVEDRPVEARLQLDLPAGTHDALVMFEERMTVVRDGVLHDTFAPHQRHVYRLDMP